jgi:hypothetical protein
METVKIAANSGDGIGTATGEEVKQGLFFYGVNTLRDQHPIDQ